MDILKNKTNIIARSLSGLTIVAIFLVSIFVFRPLFYGLFYVIAGLMLFEWYSMTKSSTKSIILGLIIIPISVASLLFLSFIDQNGWLLLTFFAIIWSVDMMAMFGGKLIGGPKLLKDVSPNKTASGLIIGVMSAIIITTIISFFDDYYLPYNALDSNISLTVFAMVIGIIAQASDLFVSYFKRKFNIKDTGAIIPGHGGVLDRFDSIILTAPLIVLYFLIIK